jgi:hypothetical protein
VSVHSVVIAMTLLLVALTESQPVPWMPPTTQAAVISSAMSTTVVG